MENTIEMSCYFILKTVEKINTDTGFAGGWLKENHCIFSRGAS